MRVNCLKSALLIGLLAIVGCDGGSVGEPMIKPSRGTSVPVPLPVISGPVEGADEERVLAACSRCHSPPPFDALPRSAWKKSVMTMLSLPAPAGVAPLSRQEAALAIAYYEARSPERLVSPPSIPGPGPIVFESRGFTPRGLEKEMIPAVAHILPLAVSGGHGPDLVVAELRSRTLMLLPAGARQRGDLILFTPGMNYPGHIATGDVDGDGIDDLLIASLGGMNPTNEIRGGATILRNRDGRFIPLKVPPPLARACDLRAADIDGDGEVDLIATAFGFRGPGKLTWIENLGGLESWLEHPIDERDGFVNSVPDDFDGDGDTDIVTILSQEIEQVILFENDGRGGFKERVLHRWPHVAWGSSSLETADIDGDGDDDLLVANGDTLDDDIPKPYHGVHWLENHGGLHFEFKETILQLPGCERAIAADVDGDGDLDIVAAAFLPQLPATEWGKYDSLVWVERLADGWQPHLIEHGNPVHSSIAVTDVDGDGKNDITVGNYVWLAQGGKTMARRDYLSVFFAR